MKNDKRLFKFVRRWAGKLLAYNVPENARYTKKNHLSLLLLASMANGFLEGVSQSVPDCLTSETLLKYLKQQEPVQVLEAFDQIVKQNVQALWKKRKLQNRVAIALDWHDVMFYGNPATPMVIGTQHKKGSCYAFEFLTCSVLVAGERIVVAVLPIFTKKDIPSLVKHGLERLSGLGIKVRYVTLDGGFFSIDTLRFLENQKIRYILHMHFTSKIKKMRLWKNRRFRYRTNKHTRGKNQQAEFDVVVAYDESKKYKYILATNFHYSSDTLLRMFNKRWGIETSYRMVNQFLIKTTSLQYVVRLFHYLFACVVYNAWVLYNEKEPEPVIGLKLKLFTILLHPSIGKPIT